MEASRPLFGSTEAYFQHSHVQLGRHARTLADMCCQHTDTLGDFQNVATISAAAVGSAAAPSMAHGEEEDHAEELIPLSAQDHKRYLYLLHQHG